VHPTFSGDELRIAARLRADWDGPPSGFPAAVLAANKEGPGWRMTAWRWQGERGIDEYELQYELDLPVGLYFEMQCDPQRKWDATTRSVQMLSASGSNELAAVHRQAGDAMVLFWVVDMPWPVSSREFVLRRKVGRLALPDGPSWFRVDASDDDPASWALVPDVGTGSVRVVDHSQRQLAWAAPARDDGVERVRIRGQYREDPMVPLPKWLLALLMDRTMPKAVATLLESAKVYERSPPPPPPPSAGAAAETAEADGSASSPLPKLLSLVFVIDQRAPPRVLLGLKKRGFGQGKFNGFGGKLQPGETMRQCAARELEEECGLAVPPWLLRARGELEFRMLSDGMVDAATGRVSSLLRVSLFSCGLADASGRVVESGEMRPQWFPVDEVPLSRMWADDKYWLPSLLSGSDVQGSFTFADKDRIVEHNVQRIVASRRARPRPTSAAS
jgi:8-oxo-dGTP pyrophosphatase MutT (NUDIX family)